MDICNRCQSTNTIEENPDDVLDNHLMYIARFHCNDCGYRFAYSKYTLKGKKLNQIQRRKDKLNDLKDIL